MRGWKHWKKRKATARETMWTCDRIQEELPDYVRVRDNDPVSVQAVRLHLLGCESCRAECRSIEQVFAIAASLPRVEPRAGFTQEVVALAAPRFDVAVALRDAGQFLALPILSWIRRGRRVPIGWRAMLASLAVHAILWSVLAGAVWMGSDPPKNPESRAELTLPGFERFMESSPALVASEVDPERRSIRELVPPPPEDPRDWGPIEGGDRARSENGAFNEEISPLSEKVWHDGPEARESARRAIFDQNLLKLAQVHRLARQESESRRALLVSSGLDPELVGLIESSLRWLADRQRPSGRWEAPLDFRHLDIGVTSLALMAFLGEGQTQSSGVHSETVARAIQFLLDSQIEGGRPHAGRFVSRAHHDGHDGAATFLYNHCLATWALLEHNQLTGRHRPAIVAALQYLLDVQTDLGGWRHTYRANTDDSSVTGWALRALGSARELGFGREVKGLERAMIRGFARLRHLTDIDGVVGYRSLPARRSNIPMTVVASTAQLQHRFSELASTDHKILAAQRSLLRAHPPTRPWRGTSTEFGASANISFEDRLAPDLFYLYFGTLFFRELGGPEWERWSESLHRTLLGGAGATQPETGRCEYWDRYFASGGYVYTTALRVLIVQAFAGQDPGTTSWDALAHVRTE